MNITNVAKLQIHGFRYVTSFHKLKSLHKECIVYVTRLFLVCIVRL